MVIVAVLTACTVIVVVLIVVVSFKLFQCSKDGGGKKPKEDILLWSTKNSVTTLTMNTPKKLNGWTQDMLLALKWDLESASKINLRGSGKLGNYGSIYGS